MVDAAGTSKFTYNANGQLFTIHRRRAVVERHRDLQLQHREIENRSEKVSVPSF